MKRPEPSPTLLYLHYEPGVAFMLALKRFGEQETEPESARNTPWPGRRRGVDVGLDGVLIDLSFAAGARQALLLTVGLVLELFFLGVSCATSLRSAGRDGLPIAHTAAFLSVTLMIGAAVLNAVTPLYVDAMLAFGVAALL